MNSMFFQEHLQTSANSLRRVHLPSSKSSTSLWTVSIRDRDGDYVDVDVRDLIDVDMQTGLHIATLNDRQTFEKRIPHMSFTLSDVCSSRPFADCLPLRDLRRPFLEVAEQLDEAFDISGLDQLITLLTKYKSEIEFDKLHDLHRELRLLDSFKRPSLKHHPRYELILCLEKVFAMQRCSLTSGVLLYGKTIAQQAHAFLGLIFYTLSTFHGRPVKQFLMDVPKDWYGSSLSTLLANSVNDILRTNFFLNPPYNMKKVTTEWALNFDMLCGLFYRPYEHTISQYRSMKDSCVVETFSDVHLTWRGESMQFELVFNQQTLVIDSLAAVTELQKTLPMFLPHVLGATSNIINLLDVNKGLLLAAAVVESGNLVVKTNTETQNFLTAMDVMVEFLFSQVMQLPAFRHVCHHFATVYAIRDDVVYDTKRNMFEPGSCGVPNTIIMEKKPGTCLYKVLKMLSKDVVMKVLVKVFSILHVLHTEIEFTHYDLHTGNIVVDELDDYEVYILDMGRCRFKVEGMWTGCRFEIPMEQSLGICAYRAYPAHDVFQLLMMCLEHHAFIKPVLQKLFHSIDIVHGQSHFKGALYSLMYLPEYADMTYKDAVDALTEML